MGRRTEFGRVAAALEDASAGTGRLVGLVGEAGVGKTRVAEEVVALAEHRGFTVLSGRTPVLEAAVPYAPILEALGDYLRSLDAVARAAVTNGLSELGLLFGSLVVRRPEPLSDPALEQARLFEAVARLVERVQRDAAVLLFVDDAHEADAASSALLGYLCRRLDRQRVLMLLTYRSDADSLRRLRELRVYLRRQGLLREVALEPLSRGTLAELAARQLGGPPSEALLDLIDARASGIPLFAEATLNRFREAGQLTWVGGCWTLMAGTVPDVPALARDVILRPLDRLAVDDRRLVDILAVAGGPVPHDRLAALAGIGQDGLVAGIGRLGAAGLVDEVTSAGWVAYRLHHPLITEVAYSELGGVTRRRLHAMFVSALEREKPADLQRLARHYRGAGRDADTDRAREVLTAAGKQALALHANREAVGLLSAALERQRATGGTDKVAGVLEKLGDALERSGEHAAAVGVWEEALQTTTGTGDRLAAGRLHRRLAAAEWERGRATQAREHLRRGAEVLSACEPSRELAELRLTEVWLLGWMDDLDAAAGAAAELGDLAGRLRSPVVMAEALLAEARMRLVQVQIASALETARRALDAAEAAGDPLLLWRAHDVNAACLIWDGDHHAMRHHAAAALACDLAVPSLEMRSCALMALAEFIAGNWEAAFAWTTASAERVRLVDQPRPAVQAVAVAALLHSYLGDATTAQRLLSEALGSHGRLDHDPSVQAFLAPAEIQLELSRDRVETAVELADRAFARGDVWEGFLLVAGAEAYLRGNRFSSALALAPRIAALATSDRALMTAEALRVEGAARAGLGMRDQALGRLGEACELFAALDTPFFTARARLDYGRTRGGSQGQAAVRDSLEVFERLGTRPYADQARRALRALGGSPPRRSATGPLSPREREVACLAAQGLTATQIAERLFISPHTARTHLKRIHERLAVSSRADLTRYVIDAGWLANTPS